LHPRVGARRGGNVPGVAGAAVRGGTRMSTRLFEGRTALVTGGGRGIGRTICLRLAEDGAGVAVNYERNAAAADETLKMVQQRGGAGITIQADVSRPADVDRMVAQARARLGPIDFLVNNAGIAGNLPHDQLTFEKWKRIF